MSTINHTVTVASGKFVIDSSVTPSVCFRDGDTYVFDQSHASNAGHTLQFSATSDNSGSSEYTTGVTKTGTAGQAGAKTTIITSGSTTDTLFYYSSGASGYGSEFSNRGYTTTAIYDLLKPIVGSVDTAERWGSMMNHAIDQLDSQVASVPIGGIVALASNLSGSHTVPSSGAVDETGWMLCDGSTIPANQTLSGNVPQLTDGRFLQGNTHANAGGVGTNNTVTLAEANLPAHNHTVTTTAQSGSTTGNASSANTGTVSSNHTHDSGSNTGSHSHNTHRNTYSVNDFYAWNYNVTRSGNASTSNTGGHHHGNTGNFSANHTHGMDHTHSYGHTHTMSCGNTGSGTAFSIVPTYLRVVYLIRVI